MIKIMVADDNIGLNSMYCEFLTKDKDIEVISQATDGQEALEKYLNLKPDLLLLDLDMPKLDGLEIINRLSKDTNEKNKCNILVISGNTHLRHNLYNTAKVYRIIPKPVDFSYILHIIKDYEKENLLSSTITEKEVRSLLIDFKLQPYTRNTNYLTDAILSAYKKPFLLANVQDLYKEVGLKNNVNYTVIQWSIRNSINSINNKIPSNLLMSIFNLKSNQVITPKHFFTMLIEYFENKEK